MTLSITSRFGIGRSGLTARPSLGSFFAALLVATSLCAQDEPRPTITPAGDRLPNDQPKGTSSTTTATTTSSSSGTAPSAGQPSEADMMKMMMEMAKLNENHKLLSSFDGTWSYTVKLWMDGDSTHKPQESKGTATRKSILDGHYVQMDVKAKCRCPARTAR